MSNQEQKPFFMYLYWQDCKCGEHVANPTNKEFVTCPKCGESVHFKHVVNCTCDACLSVDGEVV